MTMLLDHFRPPLSERRHWHSFHQAWATYLSSQLNATLPAGYFAEPNVQFGIEIDVATFQEESSLVAPGESWLAPKPHHSVPLEMPEGVSEIQVYQKTAGPILAGAIELVSPSNKDRPSHRDAFISKCASYLQAGVGLVIVDVVPERLTDLHQQLLDRLGVFVPSPGTGLFTSAYRTLERNRQAELDLWYEPLMIGERLPTMPLWLRGDLCMAVELQETYERTCQEQRLSV